MTDTTNPKCVERALEESEERYRQVAERATEGIAIIQDAIVLYANPRLAEMWGGQVSEVLGTPFINYVHPDARAQLADMYRRRIAGEVPPESYETALQRRDGTRVFVEVRAAVLTQGGRPAELVLVRDISERKHAEDALREKERLLSLSQRIADLGTWESNAVTGRLSGSHQVYRILGIQPETFSHTTDGFLDLVHPDDRTAMVEWIAATLAGDKPGELDFRVIWPDKTIRHIRGRNEAVVDASGRVVGAVGTAQDVTEWKRLEREREKAEAELREAALREQAALEASIIGLWDYYPQQNRVRLSDEWKRQLGYEPEELADDYVEWSSRLHPDDAAEAVKRLADYIDRGSNGEYYAEFRMRRKDGTYRWIQSHGRAVERTDGRVTRVLGSHVDVTAQQEAEEALRASETEYRRLFERNMAGVYASALDGRIAACNQAFADLLGYDSPSDVVAVGAIPLYVDTKDREAFLNELRSVGEVKGRESRLRRKDGRPIWVIENATMIGAGSAATLQGTLVDVTRVRETETALRERLKELTCLFHVNRELRRDRSLVETARRVGSLLTAAMRFPDKARVRVDVAGEFYTSAGYTEDLPAGVGADIRTKEAVLGHLSVRYTDGRPFLPEEEILVSTVAADLAMWYERRLARERLKKALDGTVRAVGLVAEMKDSYTSGHQLRVAEVASAISRRMGLSEKDIEDVRVASLIHDIGKMAVPAEILSKPSQLTDVEFGLIKEHPRIAYEMLTAVEFIEPVATIIVQHHERLDGSGYPHKLKGEAITRAARILAVADVVEAMASHRPYRPALGVDAALRELDDHKGTLYDPAVVDACIALFAEEGFTFGE
jgi:PAS domain S-box-containing protein/putative nucleotidyltransferase with HDIG domain